MDGFEAQGAEKRSVERVERVERPECQELRRTVQEGSG